MEDLQLLAVPVIETLYGVSRFRVYRMIANGELPAVKLGRKRLYVKRVDWENYLHEQEK